MKTEAHGMAISLGGVQETLLIPLYFRAKESDRPDAICRASKAQAIIAALDYDFAKFDSWWLQLDIAIRTEIFDERVAEFLKQHEQAVVVNLGAGLDGRFYRLDNGRVLWFDLDMPDSLALRKHFYDPSDRNVFIGASMLDYQWLDEVEAVCEGKSVLIIAEGVFCYFEEAQVRDLLDHIAARLPGAEILFHSIPPNLVGKASTTDSVKETTAEFKWGICHGRELEEWSDDYTFLGEWAYIDRHRSRWRHYRWLTALIPPVYRGIRNVMKISHVRLGGSNVSDSVK